MKKLKSLFQEIKTAYINYVAVKELDFQSVNTSNTLLSHCNELHSHSRSSSRLFSNGSYSRVNMQSDSTRNDKAGHKGDHKFGRRLSCDRFHSRNPCVFCNSKCFICGKTGHIQLVCKTPVHFAAGYTKICNSDPNDSVDSNDHILSLFTTYSNSLIVVRKPLYLSSGDFHDLVFATGKIKSIILVKKLKSLNLDTIIMPTKVSIRSITGHKLFILRCRNLLIRDNTASIINCEFLITERGPSLLVPENLIMLRDQLSL
ncbi:unnamed protein product [Schistosoma rodhaini]|nr:unnamed protein product [Schistosoma rodhaini]